MSRTLIALVTAAVTVVPGAPRAAPLVFRHARSGYADAKTVALKAPEGVVCLGDGAAMVADTGNGRLVPFTFRDGELTAGAEVRLPQVPQPVRLQVDSQKNVLVLDRKSGRVALLDAKGAFQRNLEIKGGDVRVVAFRVDRSDRLVVLDGIRRSVLVVEADGTVSRTLHLPRGRGVFTDVAVEASGRILALDAREAQLWAAEPSATEFQPLSKPLKEYMSFPGYVTPTGAGLLLVVDQNGSGLVLLGVDGAYQGRQLSVGAGDGLLSYPAQVCLGAAGEAFVADRSNNRVQVFTTVR